ncbi:MAG: hypothetical protein ABI548_09365 [Polyangiaceae bacterium]
MGRDERGKASEEVERGEDAMGLLSPPPAQGVRDEAVGLELQALEAERRARAVAEQAFSHIADPRRHAATRQSP